MESKLRILRAGLRQQLQADRQLGVRQAPLRELPELPERAKPAPTARGTGGADGADRITQLNTLNNEEVKDCQLCPLCQTRTQTVFGQGSAVARLVFVGEAPGYEEDKQGLTFVGRAGELLTRMITAMGLTRDEVFICNVLKCRPPANRDPAAEEILACSPYLLRQLAIIQPEVIVALGAPAAKTLLKTTQSIGRLRGRFHDFHLGAAGSEARAIPLMPTYHPAYLLRSPSEKSKTWDDLLKVMAKLGLQRPT